MVSLSNSETSGAAAIFGGAPPSQLHA